MSQKNAPFDACVLSCRAGSTDGNDYLVSGVIDFGDIIESPYVFEIGTTVMYTMLHCTGMDKNEVSVCVCNGVLEVNASATTK